MISMVDWSTQVTHEKKNGWGGGVSLGGSRLTIDITKTEGATGDP